VTDPNAIERTQSVWAASGSPIGSPVAASHRRTVPSQEPVAIMVRSPTRPNAIEWTRLVCVARPAWIGLPVAASTTDTVRP
jgi:hypothetical protein